VLKEPSKAGIRARFTIIIMPTNLPHRFLSGSVQFFDLTKHHFGRLISASQQKVVP
jgi:hypothetical protein